MEETLVDIRSFLARFPLQAATPASWFEALMKDFDLFVADHAANERKASATCMDFVVRYPDHPSLVTTASRIAYEELQHFRQVYALMKERGIALRPDEKDIYIRHLMKHIRNDPQGRFMDRLLVASLVEMRGIERFEILSLKHPDPMWKEFYARLHHSEKGHGHAFYHEALKIFPVEDVDKRFMFLLEQEAIACRDTPITGRFH